MITILRQLYPPGQNCPLAPVPSRWAFRRLASNSSSASAGTLLVRGPAGNWVSVPCKRGRAIRGPVHFSTRGLFPEARNRAAVYKTCKRKPSLPRPRVRGSAGT